MPVLQARLPEQGAAALMLQVLEAEHEPAISIEPVHDDAQSVELLHATQPFVWLQKLVLPLQGVCVPAGQVPLPSHLAAAVYVAPEPEPEQDAFAHCTVVAAFAQPTPLALQAPVWPQVFEVGAHEAAVTVQQRPSTQLPEAHSPSAPHVEPGVLPTHSLLVQIPERQSVLAMQALPLTQVL
jgi:hypothetical protein